MLCATKQSILFKQSAVLLNAKVAEAVGKRIWREGEGKGGKRNAPKAIFFSSSLSSLSYVFSF